MIEITPALAIPDDEVRFETPRAGGPGGQNVNKVETRVALVFDLDGSAALDAAAKSRVRERLASRVSARGMLRVVCQVHRSQAANREGALLRFVELLRWALSEEAVRVATRVPPTVRRRRLEEKRRAGRRKAERRPAAALDD